jgi:hypothetical protein
VGRADLQQPIEKNAYEEIMFEYQTVMDIVQPTQKGPRLAIGPP